MKGGRLPPVSVTMTAAAGVLTPRPTVNAQFCIHGTGREAEVVEKMYFDRLLDFV